MNDYERATGPPGRDPNTYRGLSSRPGDIRRTSTNRTDSFRFQSEEIILARTFETLEPHQHLCLIYESHEEWLAAVVPFISIGLKRGQKCIYIVDTSTADEIRTYLDGEGIDVDFVEKFGQLSILHETEVYTREGSFDPDRMIALLILETKKAIAEGYLALRATGEMTWVLRGHPGSEKLLEYEAKLNSDFFPKYPCLAICQYDLRKFDPEVIKGIIMTHPLLVRGRNIYRNFFYVEPEKLINQRPVEGEIQYWLNVLEREQRIQEVIQQSEGKYHSLFDNASDAVYLIEPQTARIIDCNKKAAEMDGYDIEELKTMSVMDLHPMEEHRQVFDIFHKDCRNGELIAIKDLHHKRKDGTLIDIEANSTIIGIGITRLYLSIVRNVTERRWAEEAIRHSEEKFAKAFHASPTLMAITTLDEGKIIEINEAYCRTLGYTREECIGHHTLELNIWADPEQRNSVVREVKKRGFIHNVEIELQTKSGEIITVIDSLDSIVLKNTKCLLSVSVDITERKKIEERIRQSERRTTILNQIARVFLTIPDEEMYGEVLAVVLQVMKSRQGIFGYISDRGDLVMPSMTRDVWAYCQIADKSIVFSSNTWGESLWGQAIREKKTYCSEGPFRTPEGHIKIDNFLTVPIVYRNKTIGLISVANKDEGYNGKDIDLLESITRNISPILNARLQRDRQERERKQAEENLKKTLDDAINTMVRIAEMRDPYTSGHQKRVTKLTIAIAQELKFDDVQIENLRIAAVIHDIGKMYVPADILSKPGKLANIELDLIKTHAQGSYEIVKSMDFPDVIAQSVLQHHERMDGSGYPSGLKGQEISMEAKILAVADVVEAMASHRPYRPALGIDKALEEISKNKGKLFDPDVVDACLRLFNEERFKFED